MEISLSVRPIILVYPTGRISFKYSIKVSARYLGLLILIKAFSGRSIDFKTTTSIP